MQCAENIQASKKESQAPCRILPELKSALLDQSVKEAGAALASTQIETAVPVVGEFDVVALLEEAAQNARRMVQQKAVTIMTVSIPRTAVIRSDPQRVRQIIMELVHNAATFTDRGRITLILISDGCDLKLLVTDTGKGMSARDIERYCHANDASLEGETAPASGGRGFRIVKHLVRSLGGYFIIYSKLGEGTIVEVRFPLEAQRVVTQTPIVENA